MSCSQVLATEDSSAKSVGSDSTPATGQVLREILMTVSPFSTNRLAAAAPMPELAPVRIAIGAHVVSESCIGGDRVLQPRTAVTVPSRKHVADPGRGTCRTSPLATPLKANARRFCP